MFHKIISHKYAPLFSTLFFFLCVRLISLFVFYNGFTINFPRIASFFHSGIMDKILLFVPYHNFSICLSAFAHPLFLIAFLLIIWPLLKHREKLASISYTYPERLLITVSAALLSWELSTYNYNYYLDNAFYLDRILKET